MELLNLIKYKTEKIGDNNFAFLKDGNGRDWYEWREKFQPDTLKIVFSTNGVIVSASTDATMLAPAEGQSITEVEQAEVPEGLDIYGGWVFDGKQIIPRTYTAEELIAQAMRKRNSFMAVANAAIAPLQDAVDINDASDKEVNLLKAWKAYRVALMRLDLSTAPDIEWPKMPT